MPKGNRDAHLLRLLLVFVALLPMLLAAPARAESGERSLSEFYEALEPYGRWIEHPRWGFVWRPDVRDPDWRPYFRGHWALTHEHGWLWVSDEDWGWATYHYGRWILDDDYGWLWLPGTEWAPAWVAWRFSDDHVGWAPLPPEAEWRPERGELSFHIGYYDTPRFAPVWCFVHPRFMTRPGLHRHIAPRRRNILIVSHTRPVIDYTLVDRRIVNRGVDVRVVERGARRPIAPVRLRTIETPREHGLRRGDRTVISIYRPSLTPRPGEPGRPRIRHPGEVRPHAGGRAPSADSLHRGAPDGGTPAPPSGTAPLAEPPLPKARAMPPGRPSPSEPRQLKGRFGAPLPPEGQARPGTLPEDDRGRKAAPAPHLRRFQPPPKVVSPPAPPPGSGPKRDRAPLLPPEGRTRPTAPLEEDRARKWAPTPHSSQPPRRLAAPPPAPPGAGLRRDGRPPPAAGRSGEGSEGQSRRAGAPDKRRDRDERWPPR